MRGETDAYVPEHLSVYRNFSAFLSKYTAEGEFFFYIIQIVYQKKSYYLYRRWGRLGEKGKIDWKGADPRVDVETFQRHYFSKTRNRWGKPYVYRKGYVPVEVTMGQGRFPFPSLYSFRFPPETPLGIIREGTLTEAATVTNPLHKRSLLPIFPTLETEEALEAASLVLQRARGALPFMGIDPSIPFYREVEPFGDWRVWELSPSLPLEGRILYAGCGDLLTQPRLWRETSLYPKPFLLTPGYFGASISLRVEVTDPAPSPEAPGEWKIPSATSYKISAILQFNFAKG